MTTRADEIDRAEHATNEHLGDHVHTTPWAVLREEALADPALRAAYERRRLAHELGQQVRAWRTEAGLTQTELAERIGTKQQTIARLEAGGREPALSTLTRIAAALGGTIDVHLRRAG
jgi:DNA-binding XRE family transcriptional regulator